MKDKTKSALKGLNKLSDAEEPREELDGSLSVMKVVDNEEIEEIEVKSSEEGMAEGDEVVIGEEAAPDGEYTIEDGTKITVKDGLITTITPKEEEAEVTDEVKFEEGAKVGDEVKKGEEPAPDGEYPMEDGSTAVVKEGKIESIKPKDEAVADEAAAEEKEEKVQFDTEAEIPVAGVKATLKGEPAPDDVYELEDGTKVTVKDGAVESVEPKEVIEDEVIELDMEIHLQEDNDEIEIGDTVSRDDGEPVEDGEYDMDGLMFSVVDGKITEIEDVVKKIVKGKVKKLSAEQVRNKKKPRGGLSPAAYRAKVKSLKKARRKSHTAGAKRSRSKSMKIRSRKVDSVEDTAAEEVQTDGLDLEKIGTALRVFIHKAISDKFELSEDQSDKLDELLIKAMTEPALDDETGLLKITFPKWSPVEGEGVDIEKYDQFDAEFKLEEDINEESVISGITDDFGLGTEIFDQGEE